MNLVVVVIAAIYHDLTITKKGHKRFLLYSSFLACVLIDGKNLDLKKVFFVDPNILINLNSIIVDSVTMLINLILVERITNAKA
jgi:hypothetical protein